MKRDNYPVSIEAVHPPAGAWKRGVTLIELMVAAVIMVVVTGAAFTLFRVTATYQKHQQDLMTQTQNLRAALYTVGRDIRMAGSSLPMFGLEQICIYVAPTLHNPDYQAAAGWFTYAGETKEGARAVYGTNSGANENKSDSLTLFYAEPESTFPLGSLAVGYRPGPSSQKITLQETVTEGGTYANGDILAISDGLKAVIVQVTAAEGQTGKTLDLGPRFLPQAAMPGSYEFSAGSLVYNLRNVAFVTYYVDTVNHRLMADYHDAELIDEDADDLNKKHLVTVADNIEDFQVSYFLAPNGSNDLTETPDINLNVLEDNQVRAVRIAMVSRSQNRSPVSAEAQAIEVMGHKAKEEKGFSRRVLSEIVQLRNFGVI